MHTRGKHTTEITKRLCSTVSKLSNYIIKQNNRVRRNPVLTKEQANNLAGVAVCLQCFDAVGWVAGGATGL